MPALQMIDVSRNNLSGVVPSGWGIPGQSLFVTSGESERFWQALIVPCSSVQEHFARYYVLMIRQKAAS